VLHLAGPVHVRVDALQDRRAGARADRDGAHVPRAAGRDLERAGAEPEVRADARVQLGHGQRRGERREAALPAEPVGCGCEGADGHVRAEPAREPVVDPAPDGVERGVRRVHCAAWVSVGAGEGEGRGPEMPWAAASRSVRWRGTPSVSLVSLPKIGGWYATTTAASAASASCSTAGVRLPSSATHHAYGWNILLLNCQ
jgi:hypothetical protein